MHCCLQWDMPLKQFLFQEKKSIISMVTQEPCCTTRKWLLNSQAPVFKLPDCCTLFWEPGSDGAPSTSLAAHIRAAARCLGPGSTPSLPDPRPSSTELPAELLASLPGLCTGVLDIMRFPTLGQRIPASKETATMLSASCTKISHDTSHSNVKTRKVFM